MPNNTWTVYAHKNKINGKLYIGITSRKTSSRWQNGNGYKGQSYFYRAICKYGWDCFEHTIIAEGLTIKEAQSMEVELIKANHSADRNFGYNGTLGGEANIPNKETCEKIKEHHAIISGELNPFYGKKHTEEARRKNSEAHKGKTHSFEARVKMSKSRSGEKHVFYGKTFSQEYRKKISDGCKGRRLSEETKEKLRAPWTEARKAAWQEWLRSIPTSENPRSKKIICVTTGEKFDAIILAANHYGLKQGHISSCCKGKLKSAGKHPATGEKMIWKYDSDEEFKSAGGM